MWGIPASPGYAPFGTRAAVTLLAVESTVLSMTMDDAGRGAYDSECGEQALTDAASIAEELAEVFNREHVGHELRPRLAPSLTIGGDDQPLFVFALGVALDPEFDPSQYPSAQIDDLVSDARRRIEASAVDEWDWLVSVHELDATLARD